MLESLRCCRRVGVHPLSAANSGRPGKSFVSATNTAIGLALERIRVLLADDHKTILDTITRMLAREFDVVGAVGDGRTALEETERLQPDVLITDISMPEMSGMEAVRQLTAANSDAGVVFLTVHENADYLRESVTVGALGYVLKSRMVSDLADAIKAAHAGRRFVSPFTTL